MASVTPQPIHWKAIRPHWFQPTPGFRFRDADGDEVIVIGEGGWREAVPAVIKLAVGDMQPTAVTTVFDLKFQPWTLVAAYHYKGEWHLCDLTHYEQAWWDGCSPL